MNMKKDNHELGTECCGSPEGRLSQAVQMAFCLKDKWLPKPDLKIHVIPRKVFS